MILLAVAAVLLTAPVRGIAGIEIAKYRLDGEGSDALHLSPNAKLGSAGLSLAGGDVWCRTPVIPIGLSWRPPSSVRVKVKLVGELPDSLEVTARYGCDGVHFSDWFLLEPESPGAAQYLGELEVASDGEYQGRMADEWYASEPRWNCDEDEYCRWLAVRDPGFFARSIPRIGYAQIRIAARPGAGGRRAARLDRRSARLREDRRPLPLDR